MTRKEEQIIVRGNYIWKDQREGQGRSIQARQGEPRMGGEGTERDGKRRGYQEGVRQRPQYCRGVGVGVWEYILTAAMEIDNSLGGRRW